MKTSRSPARDCEHLSRLSGAGFSLWGLVLASTKPHRLKPAPQVPLWFFRDIRFKVRHALPAPVFLDENVQESSVAAGDRPLIFHDGFTNAGQGAGVAVH